VLADLQRGMLRRARARLQGEKANVRFIWADGQCLPFDAASFDVVFLVAVLGGVPNPSACLREIARLRNRGAVGQSGS